MNAIENAGWENFLEGHRKTFSIFLCFTTQTSLKRKLTADLKCSCQTKDSSLVQKVECKEEDKVIEVNER